MDNNSSRVSLKKAEKPTPWTDPVTGEIYPGGNPNEVSKPIMPQNIPQPVAAPESPAPTPVQTPQGIINDGMKYCKFCAARIPKEAVFCVHCGCQVEQIQTVQPAPAPAPPPQPVIINNNNNNVSAGRPKSKIVALLLCFFLGEFGVHRFYEGKIFTGILWACTGGFFLIGWIIDFIILLFKPSTYYV